MSEDVKAIIEMVKNISNHDFDTSSYDYYEDLYALTGSIWEEHHCDLIEGLSKLDEEPNLDYQLLWYDSLGFPPEVPKFFNKEGNPLYVRYGNIPSQIITLGGYHDSNIDYIELDDKGLSLYIDFAGNFGKNTKEKYDIILSFNDIEAIIAKKYVSYGEYKEVPFDIDKVVGSTILQLDELPSINYIFKNYHIKPEYCKSDNRIFSIDITNIDIDSRDISDLLIICKSWSYKNNPNKKRRI